MYVCVYKKLSIYLYEGLGTSVRPVLQQTFKMKSSRHYIKM